MSIVSGVQCDWCGATAKLEGDKALADEWCRLVIRHNNPHDPNARTDQEDRTDDLCPACQEAADKALAKAEKRRRTGKVQR